MKPIHFIWLFLIQESSSEVLVKQVGLTRGIVHSSSCDITVNNVKLNDGAR
jgi:hypothetical protein